MRAGPRWRMASGSSRLRSFQGVQTLGELLPSARLCSYVEAFACPAAGRQFTGRSLWAGHRGEPVLTGGCTGVGLGKWGRRMRCWERITVQGGAAVGDRVR